MFITIEPVNDPPDAVDDLASTNEDKPVTIEVLLNDSDPDSDPLTVLGKVEEEGPGHGTATLDPEGTNLFEYTPDPGFFGEDSFVYTVSDGTGETDTATGAYCLEN